MKIEFTKDYAVYKKGDTDEIKGILLSKLLSKYKVAKEYKESKPAKKRQTKEQKNTQKNK